MGILRDTRSADEDREGEIEARIAEILELPEADQPAAFAALRSRFPTQDEFLRRCETAARSLRTRAALQENEVGPDTGHTIERPDSIDKYRILSVLGEGGMGTVYLAEQIGPVHREVALKVVKLGMDTKQILSRFELERRALARMNHDAIARVFDAGRTERGQPYFVMEYAPGEPITAYCDEHRLTVRDRIELFRQVCHGVQHAHQKGVIHRDIKPGNLLVVRDGERHTPKIIDFGLARALDSENLAHSVYTEHGQFIGTPEYMSPEQAGLDVATIDTRTDVYSLGVLLYELVSGELPFPSKRLREGGYAEVCRTLREEEPHKPSGRLTTLAESSDEIADRRRTSVHALTREVKGDLDWIILKAMAKEPELRYSSASELARDLGRYLSHEPVEAGPPGRWYRLCKLVRRNQVPLGAAAVILVVLIGGVIGTSIGLFEARAQEKLASQRADKIAVQRDEIQVEATTASRVAEFMIDMFEVSNPSESRGNSIKAREILDKTAARIDELADQPEVRARLLHAMGDVYRNLGLYPEAEPLLSTSLEIRRTELGDDHPDTLRTIDALGKLAWDLDKPKEALRYHEEALQRRRRALGDDHRDTLSSMNNYGLALRDLDQNEEALQWLRSALDRRRALLGDEHSETLISIGNMGQMLSALGKREEAGAHYREALATRRRVSGDDHPNTLISINDMAVHLAAGNKLADAEKLYREALASSRRVRGDDHRETLTIRSNLGNVLTRQGKLDEAEPHLQDALAKRRELLGNESAGTAESLVQLAMLRARQGRLDEALSLLREKMELYQTMHGEDDPRAMAAKTEVIQFLVMIKKPADAEPLAREILEVRRRTVGADHPDTLLAQGQVAVVWTRLGRYKEAEAVFGQCIDALSGQSNPAGTLLYYKRFHGQCLFKLARLADAERVWLETYHAYGDGNRAAVYTARSLVQLYDAWGKRDEAAKWKARLTASSARNPPR